MSLYRVGNVWLLSWMKSGGNLGDIWGRAKTINLKSVGHASWSATYGFLWWTVYRRIERRKPLRRSSLAWQLANYVSSLFSWCCELHADGQFGAQETGLPVPHELRQSPAWPSHPCCEHMMYTYGVDSRLWSCSTTTSSSSSSMWCL